MQTATLEGGCAQALSAQPIFSKIVYSRNRPRSAPGEGVLNRWQMYNTSTLVLKCVCAILHIVVSWAARSLPRGYGYGRRNIIISRLVERPRRLPQATTGPPVSGGMSTPKRSATCNDDALRFAAILLLYYCSTYCSHRVQ